MALSEEEQRLLEQMEAALAAEDPKLVNTLRGTTVRRVHTRRATLSAIAFFVGLAALLGGLSTFWWVSVLGFVIMLAAAVCAIYSWQHVGTASVDDVPRTSEPPKKPAGYQSAQSFMDRMEERWRRRRDEDF